MRAHTAWLKGLLETIPGATGEGVPSQVFVSRAQYPEPQQKVEVKFPYWVIHPADGTDSSDRVTGPKVTRHPRFTVHSVGKNADQAAWAGEQVKGLLVVGGFGVVPVIDGEKPKRVWYAAPIPIQVDTNLTPPLVYHVCETGFDSQAV